LKHGAGGPEPPKSASKHSEVGLGPTKKRFEAWCWRHQTAKKAL
jgi:hypothetical protein